VIRNVFSEMSTTKFTLHGVKNSLCKLEAQINAIKIAPKPKKKEGAKITTKETSEGYTVDIAYTGQCDFLPNTPGAAVQVCWQDHHPYDGVRIVIPYKHDMHVGPVGAIKHTFSGPGSFCDVFCLWTYLMEENKKIPALRDPKLDMAIQNTKLLWSISFPPTVPLRERDDWRLLDTYGGHLTIENYRAGGIPKTFIKTPEIIFKGALVQYISQ
jgi:hypothetical protein